MNSPKKRPKNVPHSNQPPRRDDTFTLRYTVQEIWVETFTSEHDLKASVNQIFFGVSPLLIQEASSDEIRAALERFIKHQMPCHFIEPQAHGMISLKLDEQDFLTAIVRLLGLGLIQESTRRRRDGGNFWTLTTAGLKLMHELRTIRK